MARVSSPWEVRDARASVRHLCHEHHVDSTRCHDAELAVSELLGNALRHGAPPIDLEVDWVDDAVLVVVADHEPAFERGPWPPPSGAESGRGLQLVDAVARSWGCDPLPDGKRVWARL